MSSDRTKLVQWAILFMLIAMSVLLVMVAGATVIEWGN